MKRLALLGAAALAAAYLAIPASSGLPTVGDAEAGSIHGADCSNGSSRTCAKRGVNCSKEKGAIKFDHPGLFADEDTTCDLDFIAAAPGDPAPSAASCGYINRDTCEGNLAPTGL